MSRIPIRVRLTLAFALVMALLLGAAGAFIYGQLKGDLDESIDRELFARLAGVVAIVRDDGDDVGDPSQDPLDQVDPGGFVQVLARGEVAGATHPAFTAQAVLPQREVTSLTELGGATVDAIVPGLGDLRFAAAAAEDDRVTYTAIVGASLGQRNEALADLRRLLLIGGPIALLFASLAGYGVASAALRPVEQMRQRASRLSAGRAGERLPVAPARDEIGGLGQTLNSMLARIEVAFARERAFVADASHELRNPLTVLRTELELALQRGRSREQLEQALRAALGETDRLIGLAEDLLVLARADEGRLPIKREAISARTLADRVSNRFANRAEAEGRRVEVALQDSLTLRADPVRLEQALSNMVDNALRHARGDILITANAKDGAVDLHVIDEGPGVPTSIAGEVFERFARSAPARSGGGAGLGLAIVAAIARAHGGSAHLADARDGGADVWISLPATQPEEPV